MENLEELSLEELLTQRANLCVDLCQAVEDYVYDKNEESKSKISELKAKKIFLDVALKGKINKLCEKFIDLKEALSQISLRDHDVEMISTNEFVKGQFQENNKSVEFIIDHIFKEILKEYKK